MASGGSRCHRGQLRGIAPFPPSSFGETPDGELLMTCFIQKKGKVYRLVPSED